MVARRWLIFVRGPLVCYAVLCVILWMLPLVNRLHVESTALLAAVAFFASGLSALSSFRRGASLTGELVRQEAALLLPLAMLTISLLWAPNCGYFSGLLFFGLFPVVSVILAVSAAFALDALPRKRPRAWFVTAGLLVVALTPFYDIALHPQFYTYNHVFGGVLGPIYDEELALRPGLFWFRGLTLLWAGLFVLGGWRLRERVNSTRPILYPLSPVIITFFITLVYLNAAVLGINTPAWYIQKSLGSRLVTPHFVLYYDSSSVDEKNLERLAQDHEYHYSRYAQRLGGAPDERIFSYLYPSGERKAALTGARRTNVSPVWLPQPQVHILSAAYERSFAHELAHVFSRPFGLPLVNASVATGLIEGFAVAMEPPDGRPTPDEQVIAALSTFSRFEQARLADEVADRLSPAGFWTSRGAVSYTTMGPFVNYLLEAYPVEYFKSAYATADFRDAYGRPLEALAEEWMDALLQRESLSLAAAPLVSARFTRPSLFEERCPHYVAPYVYVYREGKRALSRGDSVKATRRFSETIEMRPGAREVLADWSDLALAQGRAGEVAERLHEARSPALLVRLADALALLGRPRAAVDRYKEALRRLPIYRHDARMQVALRMRLAEYPSAVRALVSGGSYDERAERLARLTPEPPASRIMRALLLAAAGLSREAIADLSAAAADLAEYVDPPFQLVAGRVLLAWRARYSYHAGRIPEAAEYARRAAGAFREAGDINTAERLLHFAGKMEWVIAGRGYAVGPAS